MFLHTASFSLPLAALEYGVECWTEFSLWPAWCLPSYQSFFDAYRILTQRPSQCLLWSEMLSVGHHIEGLLWASQTHGLVLVVLTMKHWEWTGTSFIPYNHRNQCPGLDGDILHEGAGPWEHQCDNPPHLWWWVGQENGYHFQDWETHTQTINCTHKQLTERPPRALPKGPDVARHFR